MRMMRTRNCLVDPCHHQDDDDDGDDDDNDDDDDDDDNDDGDDEDEELFGRPLSSPKAPTPQKPRCAAIVR